MKIPVYHLVIFLLFAGLLAGFFLLLCEDLAGHGTVSGSEIYDDDTIYYADWRT
jgi:hypothetical protein